MGWEPGDQLCPESDSGICVETEDCVGDTSLAGTEGHQALSIHGLHSEFEDSLGYPVWKEGKEERRGREKRRELKRRRKGGRNGEVYCVVSNHKTNITAYHFPNYLQTELIFRGINPSLLYQGEKLSCIFYGVCGGTCL